MASARHILYVQYTNPAGYPPLEHSSRILADHGWQVDFAGINGLGMERLVFAPHSRIQVRLMPWASPGWWQKVHYLLFCLWILGLAVRFRPRWVYASDLFACLPGVLLEALGFPVLYHEHDHPGLPTSPFLRLLGAARRRLARRCPCVLPNADRLARFRDLHPRRMVCVWNCPARDEVAPPRGSAPATRAGLTLWFHGSLTPPQLPMTIVQALALLPDGVSLRFAGYETIGHRGYVNELLRLAEHVGVRNRVRYVGTPASRQELYAAARQADIGLVLFDRQFREPMAGASNKPFDYLACGLALLVTNTAEWERFYVSAGYARSCDPVSPSAIAGAIRWFLEHPAETRAMGEAGRQRVKDEWNYESQFRPVAQLLSASHASAASAHSR